MQSRNAFHTSCYHFEIFLVGSNAGFQSRLKTIRGKKRLKQYLRHNCPKNLQPRITRIFAKFLTNSRQFVKFVARKNHPTANYA